MAKKAAFYILESKSSPKEQAIYTCRIIEKAFNSSHKVYIHTSTSEEAQNFDNQLWTFGDISFVPHEIYPPQVDKDVPVIIGYGDLLPPKDQNNILVNLIDTILPFYQQFDRIIEVALNEEKLKSEARKRFKIYKNAGYEIEVFNI